MKLGLPPKKKPRTEPLGASSSGPSCPSSDPGSSSVPEYSSITELMKAYPLDEDPSHLADATPHPRDPSIRFEEKTHTYFVNYHQDDAKNPDEFCHQGHLSASGIIHRYFKDFDADEAIRCMRLGRKWGSSHPLYGKRDDEIKQFWEENRVRCADEGTWYHGLLERDLNGTTLGGFPSLAESPFAQLEAVQQYLKWKRECFDPYFEAFRTEHRMRGDIGLLLTGTLDLCAVRRGHPPPEQCDGVLTLNIFDWKFSQNIKTFDPYANAVTGKGYGVDLCSDLQDTNFSHYCLQQSLYKYMLETFYPEWTWKGMKYTSVRVESMHLAVFHENHAPSGKILEVEDLRGHIEQILAARRKEVAGLEGFAKETTQEAH